MEPGTFGPGSDFEIAAKLTCACSDAINTNPRAERRHLLLTHTAPVVGDYHVQPTADPSQIDRDLRCRRVMMDVSQGFLNNAKK